MIRDVNNTSLARAMWGDWASLDDDERNFLIEQDRPYHERLFEQQVQQWRVLHPDMCPTAKDYQREADRAQEAHDPQRLVDKEPLSHH